MRIICKSHTTLSLGTLTMALYHTRIVAEQGYIIFPLKEVFYKGRKREKRGGGENTEGM